MYVLLVSDLRPNPRSCQGSSGLGEDKGLMTLAGTPYEGGYFRVKFQFGPDYPNLPPKCMLPVSFHHALTISPHSLPCHKCTGRDDVCWMGLDVWCMFYGSLMVSGTMITRIFHPNVSKAGEICVDTLKKGWDRKFGIGHVLVVSLLPQLLAAARSEVRYGEEV